MQRLAKFKFAFLALVIMSLSSCMPEANNNGRRTTSSSQVSPRNATPTPAPAPDFGSNANYLQNGGVRTTSVLTLNSGFNDTLYLRGKEIHNYLKSSGEVNKAFCVISYYSDSMNRKVFVFSAISDLIPNISTGQKEFFFNLTPSNKNQNLAHCQTANMTAKIAALYPGATIAYLSSEICPSCTTPYVNSSALLLTDTSGVTIPKINTSALMLKIQTHSTDTTPEGSSCIESTTCQSKGYDCCSGGICVKNGQIKAGVDESSDAFLQAQEDILQNILNIDQYPQFYHICGQIISPTPTPSIPGDADQVANAELEYLTELYQCTSISTNEQGICTKTYKNINTNPVDFVTGDDDRNFTTTYTGTAGLSGHSIVSIKHAGVTLFTKGDPTSSSTYQINGVNPGGSFLPSIASVPGVGITGLGNDTLTDPVRLFIKHPKPASADNDDLKIKYTIDASCEPVSSTLAKCQKFYVQGQNDGEIDDHYPASNTFCLPNYADMTRTVKLEVDDAGITQGAQYMDWSAITTPCKGIKFNDASLQVYDTQKVTITYYVALSNYNVLQEKLEALESINEVCKCGGPVCKLAPIYETKNGVSTVVHYKCVYPQKPDNTPLDKTVEFSAKTIPWRYYDTSGAPHATIDSDTPAQEGTAFKYTNNNLLKPNNVSGSNASYIGFHEIYGTITALPGASKPPVQVQVTYGKTYDIFVDSGSFSQCSSCGDDFYSNLAKIFPGSFQQKGSGYYPDWMTTDRFKAKPYRSDDLHFGRACFLPATMIPWAHRPQSDRQNQRKGRLSAQHFYFANGYNRDWFGFDYGSVIGSFDGVTWFAVGNQRRIKAQSSRLFLAVNAYWGDLTLDNYFKVKVSDATVAMGSGPLVSNDFTSDGAQCQKMHQCETDTDCVTRLGWEYVCGDIIAQRSNWPIFDNNGTELVNQEQDIALADLFKSLEGNGGSKRCVYRGRGAPCVPSMTSATASFNGTINSDGRNSLALNTCAPNYHCQTVAGSPSKFNFAISRFGKSLNEQNQNSIMGEDESDLVGLAARILGRPLKYEGVDTIPTGVLAQLTSNKVTGICLPGKNASAITAGTVKISTLHSNNSMISEQKGDRLAGIGVTFPSSTSSSYMYATCPVLSPVDKNYMHLDTSIQANTSEYIYRANSQNISTNFLNIFNQNAFGNIDFIKSYSNEFVTSTTFENFRCLRTAGAACHTDLDCAPNETISSQLASIDPHDENTLYGVNGAINRSELEYWQQALICHQAKSKTDPTYDLKNNRCCRETGKNLSLGAYHLDPTVNNYAYPLLDYLYPGFDTDLTYYARYSRYNSIYPELQNLITDDLSIQRGISTFEYPRLVLPDKEDAENDNYFTSGLSNITNSLALTSEKTCCSGNWIRHFHDDNGGGYVWDSDKLQKINNINFKCLNWVQCDPNTNPSQCSAEGFSCTHTSVPNVANCLVREISYEGEGKVFMNYMRGFDYLGIPQYYILKPSGAPYQCLVKQTDQTSLPGTFNELNLDGSLFKSGGDNYEFHNSSGFFYSSADSDNFNSENMKMIFSPDKVSCCKPAGEFLSQGETADRCCTGYANSQNRCVLRDNYTNVTVYTNRLISSAAKDLNINLFDPATGTIINPDVVANLACTKNMCQSGMLARGVALSYLKVPGHEGAAQTYRTRRYVDGNSANGNGGLAALFDVGMKWNDDVYCVPAGLQADVISKKEEINVQFYNCNQ